MRSAAVVIVVLLAVWFSAPATAGADVRLSVRDAAAAITARAERDGHRALRVHACRRLNQRRVVCSLRVTREDGSRVLDRYVAFRGASGRIGVGHRPILPPAVGH